MRTRIFERIRIKGRINKIMSKVWFTVLSWNSYIHNTQSTMWNNQHQKQNQHSILWIDSVCRLNMFSCEVDVENELKNIYWIKKKKRSFTTLIHLSKRQNGHTNKLAKNSRKRVSSNTWSSVMCTNGACVYRRNQPFLINQWIIHRASDKYTSQIQHSKKPMIRILCPEKKILFF